MMKLNLEATGRYEVVVADSGAAALKILQTEVFSVIILDVIMPEMDGMELASLIIQRGIKTPFFFFTATVSPQEAAYFHPDTSGARWLAKPTSLSALCKAITQTITEKASAPDRVSDSIANQSQSNMNEITKEVLTDTSAAFVHKLSGLLSAISVSADAEALLLRECVAGNANLLRVHDGLVAGLQEMQYVFARFRNTFGRHPGILRQIPVDPILIDVSQHLSRITAGRLELGPTRTELQVKGDYELLWHLFENLIRNALEAIAGRNDGVVTVTTEIDEQGWLARIRIHDNGPGIPPEALTKIFELNYTTKPGGLGVGLYLAHRAANFHEGSIDCQSEIGAGTVFLVTLPLAPKANSK